MTRMGGARFLDFWLGLSFIRRASTGRPSPTTHSGCPSSSKMTSRKGSRSRLRPRPSGLEGRNTACSRQPRAIPPRLRTSPTRSSNIQLRSRTCGSAERMRHAAWRLRRACPSAEWPNQCTRPGWNRPDRCGWISARRLRSLACRRRDRCGAKLRALKTAKCRRRQGCQSGLRPASRAGFPGRVAWSAHRRSSTPSPLAWRAGAGCSA